MASKFNVWIDDGQVTSSNTLSLTNDSQKKVGFKAGTAASSQRVNTILRETSLVSTALMNIFDSNGTCTYASPLSAVQALMSSYFNGFVPSTRKVAGKSLTADVSLGKLTVKLLGISLGDYNGTTDVDINLTDVMTLNTVQTIVAGKTFTGLVNFSNTGGLSIRASATVRGDNGYVYYRSDKIRTTNLGGSDAHEYTFPTTDGTLLVDKNVKLYKHNLTLGNSTVFACMSIFSFTNSTPATRDTLADIFSFTSKEEMCGGQFTVSGKTVQVYYYDYDNINQDNIILYGLSEKFKVEFQDITSVRDTITTISM